MKQVCRLVPRGCLRSFSLRSALSHGPWLISMRSDPPDFFIWWRIWLVQLQDQSPLRWPTFSILPLLSLGQACFLFSPGLRKRHWSFK